MQTFCFKRKIIRNSHYCFVSFRAYMLFYWMTSTNTKTVIYLSGRRKRIVSKEKALSFSFVIILSDLICFYYKTANKLFAKKISKGMESWWVLESRVMVKITKSSFKFDFKVIYDIYRISDNLISINFFNKNIDLLMLMKY